MLDDYKGYNAPFTGGYQGVLSRQAGERLIKNDIMQLLLTSPGERVMRPSWGTLIKSSLFEQLDEATIFDLKSNIDTALSTYETRVVLQSEIAKDEDNLLITISLTGYYTEQPNRLFEMELKLPYAVPGD